MTTANTTHWRSANASREVLAYADTLAAHYGTSRRGVLTAAARAAVETPPSAPVAYPSLDVGAARVDLPLSAPMHACVVAIERALFYHRLSWLCWYGLVHHAARLGEIHRLDEGALASFDTICYERLNGGQPPCPNPTARVPVLTRR
jgi:hypothetical protein